MENSTQTFLCFPRFPKELRLRIWGLALPGPCTIEQVWNYSKLKWEFDREIPAALQASSEARREFLRNAGGPAVSSVYRCIMDARPFYICYKLDTIYVRRQFHFSLNPVSTHLRSLQMDWGLEPYWSRRSQQVRPAFIRSFPRLETFTLVVTISRWAWVDGEKEMLMGIVKKHTVARFEIEQGRHPEWRMPMINFHCRKDSVDWSICSIAKCARKPQRCSTAI